MLRPEIKKQLLELYKSKENDGEVLTAAKLERCYDTFRKRFGPDVLSRLDGEALLSTMHEHGQKESLVYWLEFKDDDELPGYFGSISGGSALKFGIYRRKETGVWMTGSPQDQKELTVDQAIQIARQHRDELLRGCRVLDELPETHSDETYVTLQNELSTVAPNVSDTAWGHKYFSLMYPDKLDDFHNPDFGRFHLIKLLMIPPEGKGRYLSAGRFVAIARELGILVDQLTTTLNYRDGFQPHKYWRVGTSNGEQARNRWDLMKYEGCVAIGWPKLENLAKYNHDRESLNSIKQLMAQEYPGDPRVTARKGTEVFKFATVMTEGDYILACDGSTVLGIGKIQSDYSYVPKSDFPHRRTVEWLSLSEWKMPEVKGLRTTVCELTAPRNLVEAEEKVFGKSIPSDPIPAARHSGSRLAKFDGVIGRIHSILERKGQLIIYGPPGTGKTYWAFTSAYEMAAWMHFGRSFGELTAEDIAVIQGSSSSFGVVRNCTFHPAYGYEDFIEGFKPNSANGSVGFALQAGIFKELCDDAANRPGVPFFLVIDEINRGDIPRIFGELLTILEKDKRGRTVMLPLSRQLFHVPSNVYLIATMNTADRSIALLDTALRRRFGFIELMPDSTLLGKTVIRGIPLSLWLDSLNRRLCENVGRDARNLQIGHSYFLDSGHPISTFRQLSRVIEEDVLPLLEEYCYEDYLKIERILGKSLVDSKQLRIRHDLFGLNREDDLVQALLEPCPDLATTAVAISSTELSATNDEVDEDETVGIEPKPAV